MLRSLVRPIVFQHPFAVGNYGGEAAADACGISWLTEHWFYRRQYFLSLNQQGNLPDQICDCQAAIRWLRANAGQYGYGIDRIVVSGCSGGGQLAALVDADGLLDQLFRESVVDFVADAAEAGELFFFGAFGVGGVVEGPVQSFDLAGECWAVVLGS